MPAWIIALLKWGGLALAVIGVVAVVSVEWFLPAPAPGAAPPPTAVPMSLYNAEGQGVPQDYAEAVFLPAPAPGAAPPPTAVPMSLYSVLLGIGVFAAMLGYALARPKE